jgi:hypothetical protein
MDATGLDTLPPAVFEAANRYMKSPSADLLEFGFRQPRAIGRGLHLFQQVSIAIALPRVLWKWPYFGAELG